MMMRSSLAALLFTAAGSVSAAQAQQDVPIQRDLKRMDRIDDRLGIPDDAGRQVAPSVTPANPDGVVGFNGPPLNYGDPGVIGKAGPRPPGSPANAGNAWVR